MNDTQSNTSQSTTPSPFRAELMQTLQRCAEAFHRVMADMPKDPDIWDREKFHNKAYLAFCAHLPVLIDPASFQIYLACISQGAAIGAIDTADAGRLCHIANSASAAWKLANLIVPAAEEKDRLARKKEKEDDERRAKQGERAANPLPPNGNHSQANQRSRAAQAGEEQAAPPSPNGNQPPTLESLYASSKLPDWEAQKAHFSGLRKRGIEIPTDEELHADPAAALHWVETNRWYMSGENVPATHSAPPASVQPAPAPPQPSKQSA